MSNTYFPPQASPRRKMPQENVAAWLTVDEIRRANRAAGGYWFSESSMRFFDSILDSDSVYGGNWFVYRNRFHGSDGSTADYWKVAHALPDGTVHGDAISWGITVGVIASAYSTALDARRHALALEADLVDCECVGCDSRR